MIVQYINYIRTVKAYSPQTCTAYQKDLKHFAAWARENIDDARWSKITQDTIETYIQDAARKEQKPSTTNRRLAALSGLYSWMNYHGYKVENPCRYISRRKVAKTVPNTISTKELRTAYEHTDGVIHVMLGLLMYSGIRISELLSLEWHDIDTDKNTIRVKGKGSKERVIHVPAECLTEIKTAKSRCGKNGIMFQYSDRFARKMIYETRHKYCDAPQLSPHAIRHTFATHLAAKGENVTTISAILGHEHLETTQKYINLAAAQNCEATIKNAM